MTRGLNLYRMGNTILYYLSALTSTMMVLAVILRSFAEFWISSKFSKCRNKILMTDETTNSYGNASKNNADQQD